MRSVILISALAAALAVVACSDDAEKIGGGSGGPTGGRSSGGAQAAGGAESLAGGSGGAGHQGHSGSTAGGAPSAGGSTLGGGGGAAGSGGGAAIGGAESGGSFSAAGGALPAGGTLGSGGTLASESGGSFGLGGALGTGGGTVQRGPSGQPLALGTVLHPYAGGGLGDGGLATTADLSGPGGLAKDSDGSLFIADTAHHLIRKIDGTTGKISTVAGNGQAGYTGDGAAAVSASLKSPFGLALDADGNLYIADAGNSVIRKITRSTGVISTVAGNGSAAFAGDGAAATAASINKAVGIAIYDGELYIVDIGNHRLRKVDLTTGVISTVAGTGTGGFAGDEGPASDAQLKGPREVDIDATGNLYISDAGNHRIRKIDSSGVITTVAGNGLNTAYAGDGKDAKTVALNGPYQPVVAANGDLYIVLRNDSRIVKVSSSTGLLSTVAGTGVAGFSGDGGAAVQAKLYRPAHGLVGNDGSLVFTDASNNRVRKVSASGVVTTVAGTALGFAGEAVLGGAAEFKSPTALASDSAGNLYIADTGNHRIRKVDHATGLVTTVAGLGDAGFEGDGRAAITSRLNSPTSVVVDGANNVYIADSANNRVRRLDGKTGVITTYAGSEVPGFSGDAGPAEFAQLYTPGDLALDAQGNLYIADVGNNRIRRVDAQTRTITTVAGNGTAGFPGSGDGGPATTAALKNPASIAITAWGVLFIADTGHHSVRAVDLDRGTIATVAGKGLAGYSGDGGAALSATFNRPHGLAVDGAGQIYVADTDNHSVRRINYYGDKTIVTLAGKGTEGYAGDEGAASEAALRSPSDVLIIGSELYVVDQGNHRIRKL